MDNLAAVTSVCLQHEIHAAARVFVAQIANLARRGAYERLVSALAGSAAGRAAGAARRIRSGRGPGRPPGPGAPKRTKEDLRQLETRFASCVQAHPGMRVEQINERLGTTTRELALPIRRLIADGQITAQGRNRATRYFPGAMPVTQPS